MGRVFLLAKFRKIGYVGGGRRESGMGEGGKGEAVEEKDFFCRRIY